MELQCLKRKKPGQPFAQGALMGSTSAGPCSSSLGGIFGLSSPEQPPPRDDGCKRRKDKLTWVQHTLTPYFDGHLWRKYGQKVIKDAPYPRLYYRCSYREDRHCLASKLVQQVTHEDMPLYEVTYMHEHTCNAAPIPAPDVVADAAPAATSSSELVLRFDSSGGGGSNQRGAGAKLQEREQYHRPVLHPSPFLMMNFHDSNGSSQPPAFPSHVLPPAGTSLSPLFPIIESSRSSPPTPTMSWSPSFPIVESSPTALSTDNDDGMFSTLDWASFAYDLDDHSQFSDHHVQFQGNTFSWETDGNLLLAHLLKGIEEEGLF